MLLTFSLIATSTVSLKISKSSSENKEIIVSEIGINMFTQSSEGEDLDPLIDLEVTVTIKEIRAFDKIDKFSDPDFYVKVFINGEEGPKCGVWHNQKYVKDDDFIYRFTKNVADDVEFVEIIIQLWDWNYGLDKLCDIASNNNENTNRHDITVLYSLKSGHWFGDDSVSTPGSWFTDYSGYGRANGCDDNSIYEKDRDCELVFDITQNDYDRDGIPYWTEVNKFGTNPEVDNTGQDDDEDNVPIEWEHKWGHYLDRYYNHTTHEIVIWHNWLYHPSEYNDHENIDPDHDSINNYEEYLTSQWGSDPFRKDIFVELDQMNGTGDIPDSLLPQGSKDLIQDAFNRQNIVYHLDDGSWGEGSGSEMIPFDDEGDNTTREDCKQIYQDWFLHGNEENWRRGVFHYGLVVYNASFGGYAFQKNAYQISQKGMERKAKQPLIGPRDVVYASAYMHELGHTLNLNWSLGHALEGSAPSFLLWWLARPYKSIMNYGYMYGFIYNLVDYSDGSRGKNDFDDWSNIDFEYFDI